MKKNQLIGLIAKTRSIRSQATGEQIALVNLNRWDALSDLRLTSISRYIRVIIGLHIALYELSTLDEEVVIKEIKLAYEENIDMKQYIKTYQSFIMMGFIANLFSVVEVTLREYLKNLYSDEYKERMSIMEIYDVLVNKKLDKGELEIDGDAFNFLRLIRNCLHNNGVFSPLPKSSDEKKSSPVYKGKIYPFIIGERPTFITWELLLDIADDMRILLFQIAKNKAISSRTELIPDTRKT